MCSNRVVHVFIGAPVITPSGMDGSGAECRTAAWRDVPFISIKGGRPHQKTSVTIKSGEGGCEGQQTPSRTWNQESDLWQKSDANMMGIIYDLVSSTELCHITPGEQSEAPNPQTDPDVMRGDVSATISADTEFLTILTSSQCALQSPGNDPRKVSHHYSPKICETLTRDHLLDSTGSPSQEAFPCSSDLFTDVSNEVFHKTESVKSINQLCSDSKSATETSSNEDYIESASSKRKKASSRPSTSSIYKQLSKKSKQSVSPIKSSTKKQKEVVQQIPAKTLTLLKHCLDKNKEYNVMVVVLQPCHIKEIKVKSGPNAGSALPLATIVVMDQTEVKREVLMWRSAAFWCLALHPGEIIVLTNLSVCEDRWRGDIFLQSSFKSKLVNLGSCSALHYHIIEDPAVKELLDYIHRKHYYLENLTPRQPQMLEHVQYVKLSDLQPELLLHSMLKVNSISILKESTYHFKGLQQNKIILTVEQVKGQTSTLVLWGTCVSWCDQIHLKKDHIWVFKNLFCKKNIISEDLELHTTPWSSCECLFDDDQRAIDFWIQYNVTAAKQMSLLSILQERYSGETQVKGNILHIEFLVPDKRKILISHQTSISDILQYLPDIIYTGCGSCKRELNIDDNNVFEQCYICLPFNQIRTFYRSAQMTIMSDDCCVCVQVLPDILEKMFLNISPHLLAKIVPSSSEVTYGTIVADLCHSLLAQTGELFLFTISSRFMLDENSIPLEEEFHLLDFHLDL